MDYECRYKVGVRNKELSDLILSLSYLWSGAAILLFHHWRSLYSMTRQQLSLSLDLPYGARWSSSVCATVGAVPTG